MRAPFKAPDKFVRYYSTRERMFKYMHLIERDAPIIYPFRFPALTVGTEQSSPTTFKDLEASREADHVYQVFLGLYPDFWYKISHPYNVRVLQLDERVAQIDEEKSQLLRYMDSPFETPAFDIWTDNARFPAVQPRNVGVRTAAPQVEFTIALFRVVRDPDLDSDVRSSLQTGEIRSDVITFGGEI